MEKLNEALLMERPSYSFPVYHRSCHRSKAKKKIQTRAGQICPEKSRDLFQDITTRPDSRLLSTLLDLASSLHHLWSTAWARVALGRLKEREELLKVL
jgi:hypothetical protein